MQLPICINVQMESEAKCGNGWPTYQIIQFSFKPLQSKIMVSRKDIGAIVMSLVTRGRLIAYLKLFFKEFFSVIDAILKK